MYQRGRASREADCRRMRGLRHVLWGGLPGENKGLSRAWGEDARRRCRSLHYVSSPPRLWIHAAKSTPVTHSVVAGVRRSIAAASDLHAVRRSLRAFAAEVDSAEAALAAVQAAAIQAGACAVEGEQWKVGSERPFAGGSPSAHCRHEMHAHVRASHDGSVRHASVCTLRPAKIPTTAAVNARTAHASKGICHPPSRSWSQPAAIGPTAASR